MTDVELLYFDSCPNHVAAAGLVEEVIAERRLDVNVRMIRVESPEEAERLRFLGSPALGRGVALEPQ
ncbi:MAG: hypothetical protein WD249_05925 [Gaiellaceae bacterium]